LFTSVLSLSWIAFLVAHCDELIKVVVLDSFPVMSCFYWFINYIHPEENPIGMLLHWRDLFLEKEVFDRESNAAIQSVVSLTLKISGENVSKVEIGDRALAELDSSTLSGLVLVSPFLFGSRLIIVLFREELCEHSDSSANLDDCGMKSLFLFFLFPLIFLLSLLFSLELR